MSGTAPSGAILADVNGDGLPDIIDGSASGTAGPKQFQVDSSGTLTTSLVSYYKLEDATDFFSTNNLTNNNSVSFDAGKVNNAADFAATSSYLSLGSLLSNATSNFSMFGWSNFPSSTICTELWYLNGDRSAMSGNGPGYGLGVGGGGGANTDTGGNKLIGIVGRVNWLDFGCTIGTGWHMVGLTYDGTTWKGYVDGSVCATTYTGNAPQTPGADFEMGRSDTNLTYPFFTGKDDEWGFWTKVFSSQEISNLYNSGDGRRS